jgi:hypothetical protein
MLVFLAPRCMFRSMAILAMLVSAESLADSAIQRDGRQERTSLGPQELAVILE